MANNIIIGTKECHKISVILRDHKGFYVKWRDLFRELNLPDTEMEQRRVALLQGTTSPQSVYFECLNIWSSKQSKNATLEKLLSALIQCDVIDIADKLRVEFKVLPEEKGEEGPTETTSIEPIANSLIGFRECKIISTDFLKEDEGFESRWKDIFRNLYVSTDIIDQKVMELEKKDSNIKIEDVYTTCLENWLFTAGKSATAARLVSILHQFQLSKLAGKS